MLRLAHIPQFIHTHLNLCLHWQSEKENNLLSKRRLKGTITEQKEKQMSNYV